MDSFFPVLIRVIDLAIVGVIVAAIVLMLLRLALNYADLNPFSRPVLMVRGVTDPFINPVRRSLLNFGFSPNMAPLVTILIIILVGWLAMRLSGDVIGTIYGMLLYARAGKPIAALGALLYGFLGVYSMLILIRIIFSWGMVGLRNRVMRFLVWATDPLLVPLRRIIPPLGVFDISPLVAFLIIWLFQAAIAGTLMRT
ncbi:MAG TPA: YggT family protein [Pyrinomonadaceae bacterium]|jgi:YggT family protein|nr:YggT family protein [Pyrinomonadaceae bacterium]